MTTQPDDHTLNACLARVIGKKIWPHPNRKVSSLLDWACSKGPWNPLHDANQMEEVEAWVRGNDVHIVYVWDGENHHWDLMPQVKFSKIYRAYAPDKKRAFALAVQAMEQYNNNNNKED